MRARLLAASLTLALGCAALPDGARSTLTAASTTAVADGHDALELTLTALDGSGAPQAGLPVRLAVTGTGNAFPADATTDAAGKATFSVTSTRAEVKTASASLLAGQATVAVQAQVQLTFLGGAPAGAELLAQPTSTTGGATLRPPVVVGLLDALGNRSAGPPLQVSLELARGDGGTLTGGEARASDGGVVVFDRLAVDRARAGYTLKVMADGGALAESVPFDVTVGPVAAATSGVGAAPPSAPADGITTVTLTVAALDLGRNPIPGLAVGLSAPGALLGASTGVTGADGTFVTTLRSTTVGPATVTATVGPITVSTAVFFLP